MAVVSQYNIYEGCSFTQTQAGETTVINANPTGGQVLSDYLPATVISEGVPTSQPATAGFWRDNGVLKYFNGAISKIMDFNDGEVCDAFGNPTGIDI